jgi:hypothetical protein
LQLPIHLGRACALFTCAKILAHHRAPPLVLFTAAGLDYRVMLDLLLKAERLHRPERWWRPLLSLNNAATATAAAAGQFLAVVVAAAD